MEDGTLFIFGLIATLMLLIGFGLTINEFKKMGEHPEDHRPEYDEEDVPPESK